MKLIIFRGRRKIGGVPIDEGETFIGRASDCGVHLDDKVVSRQHAKITVKGDLVYVEDLGGAGGLTINQKPVVRARFLAGDRLEVGPFTLFLASEALGIATSLDIDTLKDRSASAVAGTMEEETVQLSRAELEKLRGRQRTLLGAHLLIRGDQGSREFPMTDQTQTIGFADDCEIQIPGFGLITKRVAEIAPDGKGWAVVAVSRLAPVIVNGTKVDRKHLEDGDMIEVKGTKLRYVAPVGKS